MNLPPMLAEPLRRFEQALLTDAEARGALYTGSLGRGTADNFSDLDIHVWVSNEVYASAPAKLHQLLATCGTPQFAYMRGTDFLTGFVGPEWRRTDVGLMRDEDLKPDAEFANATVVKDSDGMLARLVAASEEEAVTATVEQAEAMLAEAVDSQVYLALHNARGAVWSAMGEVSYRATELYVLLARLRGRHSYGLRYVETLLSPEEQAKLTAAWPQSPDRDEVRRAARALWTWTRHVWNEAERILGQPVRVTVAEEALLEAVDRIYTWPLAPCRLAGNAL